MKKSIGVSLASLTHLRIFAGTVVGSQRWDFDAWTDQANRKRNREARKREKRRSVRLIDLL